MTDFETHSAGTAARIAGKTIADWIEFARRDDCLDYMVPSDLRQVISALTRANAATAAAYEAAARLFDDGVSPTGKAVGDMIRALATPDQTAALDKLIAEAVDASLRQAAFWVEEAMVIVAPDGVPQRMALDSYRKQFSALIAASKKGGV